MFFQPPQGQGTSRPFVVGLVLLILFLSIQSDWSPGPRRDKRDLRGITTTGQLRGKGTEADDAQEGAKEKVRQGTNVQRSMSMCHCRVGVRLVAG